MLLFSSVTDSAPVFTIADLEGTWYEHELGGGIAPWWAHFTMEIDAGGSLTANEFLNSTGDSGGPSSGTVNINGSGVITVASQGISAMHGVMSGDRQLIVATATEDSGPALIILQKAGSLFTQADLMGSWYEHELGSGIAPWWAHFTMEIDAVGSLTATEFLNSAGDSGGPSSGTINISGNGVVTVASQGISVLHGVMSEDRQLIVATATEDNGPALIILQKAGGSFTQADLEGTWYEHELGGGADPWWARMTMQINADGSLTATNFMNTAGDSGGPSSGTISISGSGVVTVTSLGILALHGVMSGDRQLIVATATEDNGPALILMEKGLPDTDGDGMDDVEEIRQGRNPFVDERTVIILFNTEPD
ncbi:MAG: hypothetical protein A3I78_08505 [Gammaproteobacteria bacterium RIFCSPLOWO2_02_FULL_56_15]|nr:MAG: hypothetical protein A3I78_08505 [Gammaproteobacteria bacterium RIFCSPLOWO2_02_FULL_56_15]